jgi:hypothetical protein
MSFDKKKERRRLTTLISRVTGRVIGRQLSHQEYTNLTSGRTAQIMPDVFLQMDWRGEGGHEERFIVRWAISGNPGNSHLEKGERWMEQTAAELRRWARNRGKILRGDLVIPHVDKQGVALEMLRHIKLEEK